MKKNIPKILIVSGEPAGIGLDLCVELAYKKFDAEIETRFGKFRLRAYQQTTTSQVHLALSKGNWTEEEAVLTRINSSRINNDVLGMITGKTNSGLEDIFSLINKNEKGAILFINQEQSAENLLSRIETLKNMQSQGQIHKVPPLIMDSRDFGIGAQILHDLKIKKLTVISNSSNKPRIGITGYGLEITGYVNY